MINVTIFLMNYMCRKGSVGNSSTASENSDPGEDNRPAIYS